jgi:hypothetical protein
MSTLVHCPGCRASLRISEEKADHLLRCPKCKKHFRLRPANAAAAAPPAAARKPASARPPIAPAPVRRPVAPATIDRERTMIGQDLPPAMPIPPPVSDTPAVKPARGKGGLLRWVLLSCLLTLLLGGGGLGGYYLWTRSGEPASQQDSGATEVNPAFGKWGVIEIGSKGIKALVLDVFESNNKDGYDFKVLWQKDAAPTLVATGPDKLAFAPQALDAAGEHVKQFHTTIRETHAVPPERIYVVSSSGLWVPFEKNADALAKNRAALTERVKAAADCPLAFITATDEGRLGMKTCVPPKEWDDAVFIDIGSGNIKGGYFESEGVFEAMSVELGSVTYVKKVKSAAQPGQPFAEQAAALRPTALEQPLREQIDRMPGLARQKKVHLAGGAVWALATFTHPTDRKPRLELNAADIDRFTLLVLKSENDLRNEVLSQVKDPEHWKKMDKEIANVQKKFKPENLQAAAEILKALSIVYRFPDKQLYFFRNSYIAWPLGFVLEKNRIRK